MTGTPDDGEHADDGAPLLKTAVIVTDGRCSYGATVVARGAGWFIAEEDRIVVTAGEADASVHYERRTGGAIAAFTRWNDGRWIRCGDRSGIVEAKIEGGRSSGNELSRDSKRGPAEISFTQAYT